MSYELKQSDIFGLANYLNAETHQKGDELNFKYCPYCHGGCHDKDTFSINLEKGVFKCLRSSCGKTGHFVELCRDFDYPLEMDEPTTYRRLAQPTAPAEMRDSSLAYLAGRGIGRETAQRFDVTARRGDPKTLCFPFYDENGIMVTIKYRNMAFRKGVDKTKEWFEKNTRPILFGMKQCVDFETAVITEGQLDAMSVSEAGIKNAISVPNGCSSFTWLTSCSEWINRFNTVIVFGDWEHGKMTLLDTLRERLDGPIIKAVRRKDYLGEKDANDILRKYGPEAVRRAVESAETPKIDTVKDLSTVTSVDINSIESVKTGIREIDRTTGGLMMGQLVILTGERGQGKSTFLSQIICNVLDQRDPEGNPYTVFCYSGELTEPFFKRWLDFQAAGSDYIETNRNEFGEDEYSIRKEVVDRINKWYAGRMFIYDNAIIPENDVDPTEMILNTVEQVIRQLNVRIVAIDNLMTALESIADQNALYLGQSKFVGKLKKLAMKYNVVIITVAHPRKSVYSPNRTRTLDNDDVSGSADITNKADVVFSCSREKGTDDVSNIQIMKNRVFGRLRVGDNAVKLSYSLKSRRMCEFGSNPVHYGWEKDDAGYTLVNMKDEDLPF